MKKQILVIVLGLLFSTQAQAQLLMPTGTNDNIQEKVATYFPDNPTMMSVAKCESGFRQFSANGMPLRGGGGAGNIGIFQINEQAHAQFSQSLGFDIYTVEGNLGYAKYLYDKQGTKPWVSCLSSTAPSSVPAPTSPGPVTSVITMSLKIGTVHAQVKTLQQLLNASGYAVAATGPGSAGNETTMFGSMTREAVKRFQCAQSIVCEGSEGTTGYGYVGVKTRAALHSLALPR